MGIRLDHDEFALVHAGHQMRQESAPVVAIETTPGWGRRVYRTGSGTLSQM